VLDRRRGLRLRIALVPAPLIPGLLLRARVALVLRVRAGDLHDQHACGGGGEGSDQQRDHALVNHSSPLQIGFARPPG
jgi:hypothetical protein